MQISSYEAASESTKENKISHITPELPVPLCAGNSDIKRITLKTLFFEKGSEERTNLYKIVILLLFFPINQFFH